MAFTGKLNATCRPDAWRLAVVFLKLGRSVMSVSPGPGPGLSERFLESGFKAPLSLPAPETSGSVGRSVVMILQQFENLRA